MQEEVEQRMVTLSTQTAKFTARELKQLISKYLVYQRSSGKSEHTTGVTHHGKQSVKQLAKQNQGLQNMDISSDNIKSFDRVARKYGVDYALKKDKTVEPPKYIVFFKARDESAINSAFHDYTKAIIKQKQRKDSVLEKLKKAKDSIKEFPSRIKHKELER